jgi:hypothetical protein
MRTTLYRDFIEIMVKMQRNQLLFNQNGIKEVSLTIENSANIDVADTVITYNVGKQKWIVNSETHHLENNEWDPTLLEVKEFLDYFQDFEILVAIQTYEDKVKKYFEKIPSSILINKFVQTMELMALPINKEQKNNPNIIIDDVIISYDFENKKYMKNDEPFEIGEISELIGNKSFADVFEALNNTWKTVIK